MNSSGDGHGEFREIPDDFDFEETEIVETPVNITDNRNLEGIKSDTHYYFCLWCDRLFKGERGYKIHLKQVAGDEDHPPDAAITDRHYTLIPADSEGQPFVSEEEIRERVGSFLNSGQQVGVGIGLDDSSRSTPDDPSPGQFQPPENASDPEKVAALIEQEPALFHDPGTVCDIVGCSRTVFYEGRNLYRILREQQEGDLDL